MESEFKADPVMMRIEGLPKGKGRPRFTRTGHAYTPSETRQYETLVTASARAAMKGKRKIEKPSAVRVYILAVFPVPTSWSKKRRIAALQGVEHHTKKPDVDNVIKAVCDGVNGIVFEDDSQIVEVRARKAYGSEPYVSVLVEEVKNG